MNDLEHLLRETLAEQAEGVDDAAPEQRAASTIAAGHRVRSTRQRRAAAVMGVVALALGGAGFAVVRDMGREAVPAPNPLGTPSRTSSATEPSASRTPSSDPSATTGPSSDARPSAAPASFGLPSPRLATTGDASRVVASLPKGTAAANLPRVVGPAGAAELVTEDVRVQLGPDAAGAAAVVRVGNGWVVQTMSREYTGGGPDAGATIRWVGRPGAGTAWHLTGTFAWLQASPDQRRVAWLVQPTSADARVSVEVHDAVTGKLVKSFPVPVQLGNDPQMPAWTPEGVVLTGHRYGWTTLALDPDTGAMRELGSPQSIARTGTGEVVVVRQQGDQQCAVVGESVATASTPVTCAPEVLTSTSVDGAVHVITTLGPSAAMAASDQRVWLVLPGGAVVSGVQPWWLANCMGVESPTVWLMSTMDDPTVLVRWNLEKGTLERVG